MYVSEIHQCFTIEDLDTDKYVGQGLVSKNWDEAVEYCEAKGMRLANPTTIEEYIAMYVVWLQENADADPRGKDGIRYAMFWRALNDKEEESVYRPRLTFNKKNVIKLKSG